MPKILLFLLIINILAVILLGATYLFIFIPVNVSIVILLKVYFSASKYGSTIFHPLPLTSIILIVSFVLAPIVSIGFNTFLFAAPRNIDWSKWMIVLSWLYFIGIILFYFGNQLAFRRIYNKKFLPVTVKKIRFLWISLFFLLITLASQLFVFYKYGGFLSYLTKWTESRDEFDGLGLWYMLAEPFPIIFLIFILLWFGKEKFNKNIVGLIVLFLVFFTLKIFFGGLRGSRSNTIWGLFWFAGIIHLYLFRLRIPHVLAGVIFFLTFMSSYTIYKTYGVEAFSGDYSIEDTNRFESNPLIGIYLGDFSRGTINAYQIAQIEELGGYEIKYGQTYIASLSKIIPPLNSVYNGHSKNSAGAEILNNTKVSVEEGNFHNSRVYGIYGEGILNFGVYFGLLAFFVLGVVVTTLDNICRKHLSQTIFIMLIPFLSNLAFAIAVSDSDNLVFFTFKNGLVIFIYLFIVNKFCVKSFQ